MTQNRFVVRSAQELRERLPSKGFEKCWNESIDTGGYTILNQMSGRVYYISYGRKNIGNSYEGKVSKDDAAHFLSIEYLGLDPSRAGTISFNEEEKQGFFAKIFGREPVPSFYNHLINTEIQVVEEMKLLAHHCREKLSISYS